MSAPLPEFADIAVVAARLAPSSPPAMCAVEYTLSAPAPDGWLDHFERAYQPFLLGEGVQDRRLVLCFPPYQIASLQHLIAIKRKIDAAVSAANNLRVACCRCNNRKRNKLLEELSWYVPSKAA